MLTWIQDWFYFSVAYVGLPGRICEGIPVGECGDIGVLGDRGPVWDWGDMRVCPTIHPPQPGPPINILFGSIPDDVGIPRTRHDTS